MKDLNSLFTKLAIDPTFLLLEGDNNTGKTFSVKYFINQIAKENKPIFYFALNGYNKNNNF